MASDESPPEKHYPLSTAKMSKTPSWIMLGFVLGALFVLKLPPLGKTPPEPAVLKSAEPAKPPGPRIPPEVTTIEAVFEAYGKDAKWENDVTEVALWNEQDKDFTNFYEVRRFGPDYYFRTLPKLTRRIISRGKPSDSPMRLTETQEEYREWLQYGRIERNAERVPLRPTADPRSSRTTNAPAGETIRVAPPSFEPISPPLNFPAAETTPKKE